MNVDISNLQPQPNDLVVIPENLQVDTETFIKDSFHVMKLRYLDKPSIIRSGTPSFTMHPDTNSLPLIKWLSDLFSPRPLEIDNRDQAVESKVEGTKPFARGKVQVEPPSELPRFWRYARGIQSIQHHDGEAWTISPKGGVAFLIELDAANRTFAFSYALCNSKENFHSAVARAITKQRFESEDWYEVKNYDGSAGIIDNIRTALGNLLSSTDSDKVEIPDTATQFSSLSERMNLRELQIIFERI